jgi:hypothetical protein
LKKKHRKHYSNDAKEIITNVYKHLLESGCKAVGKKTARLTGVNETTYTKNLEKKIWKGKKKGNKKITIILQLN